MLLLCTELISCSSGDSNQPMVNAKRSSLYNNVTVEENDKQLKLQNGIYYYKDALLSGDIISHYTGGEINEKSSYISGKQEGYSFVWFENGTMQSKRYYVNGEKHGTHYGWYADGSNRFEYNFDNGINSGTSTEWYNSGQIAKKTVYANGNEESVRAWRDNGKLYINYVVRDGVIYGMNNSHLCYTLKNEKGEYVAKK